MIAFVSEVRKIVMVVGIMTDMGKEVVTISHMVGTTESAAGMAVGTSVRWQHPKNCGHDATKKAVATSTRSAFATKPTPSIIARQAAMMTVANFLMAHLEFTPTGISISMSCWVQSQSTPGPMQWQGSNLRPLKKSLIT